MYKQFKEIFNKYNIIKCEQFTKGFSKKWEVYCRK